MSLATGPVMAAIQVTNVAGGVEVLLYNPSRDYAIIYNNSANVIYLKLMNDYGWPSPFPIVVTAAIGYPLQPGQTLQWFNTGPVWAITNVGGNSEVRVQDSWAQFNSTE